MLDSCEVLESLPSNFTAERGEDAVVVDCRGVAAGVAAGVESSW